MPVEICGLNYVSTECVHIWTQHNTVEWLWSCWQAAVKSSQDKTQESWHKKMVFWKQDLLAQKAKQTNQHIKTLFHLILCCIQQYSLLYCQWRKQPLGSALVGKVRLGKENGHFEGKAPSSHFYDRSYNGCSTDTLPGLCRPEPFFTLASCSYSRQSRQGNHSSCHQCCLQNDGNIAWNLLSCSPRRHPSLFPLLPVCYISGFQISQFFKTVVFVSSKSPKCSSNDRFRQVLPPRGDHFCAIPIALLHASLPGDVYSSCRYKKMFHAQPLARFTSHYFFHENIDLDSYRGEMEDLITQLT